MNNSLASIVAVPWGTSGESVAGGYNDSYS